MYCLSAICHFALEGCFSSSVLLIHCLEFNKTLALSDNWKDTELAEIQEVGFRFGSNTN